MRKILLVLALSGLCLPGLFAQKLTGIVTDLQRAPLPGASVYWIGTHDGVLSAEDGRFEIAAEGKSNWRLVASLNGFMSDTLDVTGKSYLSIALQPDKTLDAVVISEQRDGVIISDIQAIKTEQITQTELRKAACCDLAGCFETQTTVQPQVTNVITNAKELRILGLSGVYNQVLIDGLPMVQALSYTYGISSIPGPLVENIYVAKGANSVLQGFESISGQINVETIEPDKADRLSFNAYANSFGEKHANAAFAFKGGAKWHNLTAVHMVQPAGKVDRDADNFLDLPRLRRYLVSNKWKYGNEQVNGWNSKIGLRYFDEQRTGGQMAFDPRQDKGSHTVYGQVVNIRQPELWTKTAYRFSARHALSLQAASYMQQQNSFFGTVQYDARQFSLYGNIQYEFSYAAHELKTGLSYRHLDLRETVAFTHNQPQRSYDGDYRRLDQIPGLFAENTMRFFQDKLTWITGIRADRHPLYGNRFTPRTLLKYDLAPRSILRANAGTGWRIVNLFSENIGLLVSSRDIVFAEALLPEQALNFGLNFTQKFETADENLSGYFSADYYETHFQNQIFPDYDSDPTKAIIQNFGGTSLSRGFQAELSLKLWQRFDVKTGYTFLDVYRQIGEERQLLPFNPRHKVLGSFSYQPLHRRYHFDMNLHGYGRQRLPNTQNNPAEFRRPDFSKPFAIANVQLTGVWERFELYGGCENLFDFRQLQPILSWQDPFSIYFDTSSVWGPTRGRELYIGLRVKLPAAE